MNLDLLLEPFALRALAAAVAVGVAAPVIGSFLVQRRLALIGDGMGHLAFAGVGLGVLLGVTPVWGALVVAVLGGVVLERLRMRGRLGGELSLALVFYAGIAGGAVILSASGRFDASIVGVLFGSILTTSWSDVAMIAALCGTVVLVTTVFYQALLAVALDEDTARAAGLPVDGLNVLLISLTAVLVTAGMRAVGLLLVAALLVVPVAAGARLAHSFLGSLRWAVIFGVLSAVVGLGVALVEGSLAPGGTIVLASLVAFAVATAAGRRVARRHRPGVAR